MVHPMFRNAWNTSMVVKAPAMTLPMASGHMLDMRSPATSITRNRIMTVRAPTSPSSSPTTAKMKSESEANRYWYFSCELPSPTPNSPPSAKA